MTRFARGLEWIHADTILLEDEDRDFLLAWARQNSVRRADIDTGYLPTSAEIRYPLISVLFSEAITGRHRIQ